jgi:hypothetical protein
MKFFLSARTGLLLLLCAASAGCASVRSIFPRQRADDSSPASPAPNLPEKSSTRSAEDMARAERAEARRAERIRAEAHARLKPSPRLVPASARAAEGTRRAALTDRRLRVVVSTSERTLWLLRDTTVLFSAPIAVGMQEGFVWAGKAYDFQTPFGKRTVLAKGTDPLWVPPEWHYYEKALEDDLTPVFLQRGKAVTLTDNTRIEIRGDDVGRVNHLGNFWPFTPGDEIIFDEKIFIPPIGTNQRRVPLILGTRKLEIGDGYLIHGTNEETSIGDAVSHGCVRMFNEDVVQLYEIVPIGTPVYIF